MNFSFTLWDVEHGLSIWIQTPSGQNHCIDAGHNNDTEFSPFKQMKEKHDVNSIDYLIISHPDQDHIEGLPNLIDYIGKPRVFCRNKSLPNDMKYGTCDSRYQKIFKELDSTYTLPVPENESPTNEKNNGNVTIYTFMNNYTDGMSCNNTSVISLYAYKDWLFVFPGDIEPTGWDRLQNKYYERMEDMILGSKVILVAPHHGRPSSYSQNMIDFFTPNLILVSDRCNEHETDKRYYTCASGLTYKGDIIKFLSTKTKGRINISIDETGYTSLSTAFSFHS